VAIQTDYTKVVENLQKVADELRGMEKDNSDLAYSNELLGHEKE
jgi:hypothetical protein